jgi:hypothetical protein|nr:MAG TPA: hypothetical protein [Caudoviricetes sp.]
MRLIDADTLKEYCMRASKSDDDFRRVSLATLASVIDAQPTAYDVDKVVEQLEEYREEMEQFKCGGMLSDMIEVVKAGGADGN